MTTKTLLYDTATGQLTAGDATPAARATATVTTASLANNASETGTISMAKGYRVLHIVTDRACRVQLYGNAASRTSDASRTWGTDPTEGIQVPLDYRTAGAVDEDLNWPTDGYNTEASPSTAIPYRITNLSGSTHTVTVTLTYQQTE